MYVPEPVAQQFRGPGKVLTTGVALLAAIFGVAAFKLIGLGIFVAGVVLLLVVELWRDSKRLTDQVRAKDADLEEATSKQELAVLELDEARNRLREIPHLQDKIEKLDQMVAELRQDLETPVRTFEQLLDAIGQQLRLIGLVQKHRLMAQEGGSTWPLVRTQLVDGEVVLTAYIGDGAERLVEEWVSVVDGEGQQVLSTQIAATAEAEASVVVVPERLPPGFVSVLAEKGSYVPEGYTLQLGGLHELAYVDDEALDRLKTTAKDMSDELMAVLSRDDIYQSVDMGSDQQGST